VRSFIEHRDHILADLSPLPARRVPVAESLGLVLAEDVVARVDLPGFDNSAMDGYAVRSADLVGASADSPVVLPVDGDIAAGDTTRHSLAAGRVMRIMTGAPMPDGADAIVPVEASDGSAVTVSLMLAPEAGRHIRPRGEDVRLGTVVLRAGQRIGPGHLALAAAANVAEVSVHPRPRVAVYSTGNELQTVGSELAFGQIVDSNGAMLAALVRAADAELVTIGHLDDDPSAVRALLEPIPGSPDLLLTAGGVSMGAYDTVKEVLSEGGVDFVKVAMRPGMPQGSGRIGPARTPIITLPGNPVSSLVSFQVFVLPALRRLAGLDPLADGAFEGVAAVDWPSIPGRVDFTRVLVGPDGLRPSGGQGSHQLGALADATAVAVVPATDDHVVAGQVLTCLPLLGTLGA